MGTFWEIIASNAVVATILAILATGLGRVWRNAAAVHVLWVVVLLKLFAPPLITAGVPFALISSPIAAGDEPRGAMGNSPARDQAGPADHVAATGPRGATSAGDRRRAPGIPPVGAAVREPLSLSTILAAIWICGAGCAAAAHAVRIRRFVAVIREPGPAPPEIRAMVARLSGRLDLRRVPDVRMTARTLPPLVWSIGRSPCLILPIGLFARLGREAQAAILAHELAHIRRGDHLVRLLELAATTVFWWHPVVWWAARQLHELEELCCDGRVLELVPDRPRTYAAALVDTLEFLSERPRTPVPLPTAIDSAGSLSRRIHMLAQSRTSRLSALSAALISGLVAFPLVVTFAADPRQKSDPRPGARPPAGAGPAILRGRVTDEAGAPLADVRVRMAIPAADMRFVDVGRGLVEGADVPHKLVETRTDAGGAYRVEIPGLAGPMKVSLDAMKPRYRRLVGTLMAGGDPKDVEVTPGAEAEASLKLKPSLYFRGTVVDEQGKPISGVNVSAQASYNRSSGGIERTATNPDGSFELFCYPEKLFDIGDGAGRGRVFFFHPDYIDTQIDDVYALAPRDRESVRVVLRTGYKVTGTVIGRTGKPAPKTMVKAVLKDEGYEKGTLTDANGRFALRGLREGLTLLNARNLEIKQKTEVPIALNGDKIDLQVRLKAIMLPAGLKSYSVLGMQLADVTPELKTAYDLPYDRGALILDPGPDADRLKIGDLKEGDVFWMVGQQRVGTVREFVDRLLADPGIPIDGERRIRVVYGFIRVDAQGTNTQHIRFSEDERKQLQMLSDQLEADSP
jgi:beta-lactamase regulating signal transducer with metallopeptidase domain